MRSYIKLTKQGLRLCLVILVLMPGFLKAQESQKFKSVDEFLSAISDSRKNDDTYHFISTFKAVNPLQEDSVINIKVNGWLKTDLSDSIFGAQLHLKSSSSNDVDEFFYDGKYTYAINNDSKSVIKVNSTQFPNNQHNPAKSWKIVLPLSPLLFTKSLRKLILDRNPTSKLIYNDTDETYLIQLEYPENFGATISSTIKFNSKNYQLISVRRKIRTSSITYHDEIFIHYLNKEPSAQFNIHQFSNQKKFINYEITLYEDNDEVALPGLVGSIAPNFKSILDMAKVSQDSLGKKVVLLDFWESWCGYCIEAIPKLNDLIDSSSSQVIIIGLYSENQSSIQRIIDKKGIRYHNVFISKNLLKKYNVTARPTYFLIDASGKILAEGLGDLNVFNKYIDSKLK